MFVEQTADQLKDQLANPVLNTVVFFHTPLCGTCKLARRMLEIVDLTIGSLTILTCNMNLMPEWAQTFKIESVPALVVLRHSEPVKVIYAFQSVDYLYNELKQYAGPQIRRIK